MLCAVLNKSWKKQPTKQQWNSHLPLILQTIQIILQDMLGSVQEAMTNSRAMFSKGFLHTLTQRYIFIYICICECIYIHIYTHIYIWTPIFIYLLQIYAFIYAYINIYIYIEYFKYINIYVCVCVCVCVCIYIYIYNTLYKSINIYECINDKNNKDNILLYKKTIKKGLMPLKQSRFKIWNIK